MSLDFSGALSSAVGSILGFGGNLATSAINSSRSWKYAQRAMALQDEYNRKYYRWTNENGMSFARKGLEKAGYNPLLALGTPNSGMSAGVSGGSINSDSDNGSQAVSSALDAIRLRNETKMNKSQIKLNQSQEDLNTQATYKTYADELKSRAEANVASATEAQIYNNINWDNILHDAEFKKILAETRYTNERSRGFSASSSDSKHYGAGAFSVKGDYSSSRSNSRSW